VEISTLLLDPDEKSFGDLNFIIPIIARVPSVGELFYDTIIIPSYVSGFYISTLNLYYYYDEPPTILISMGLGLG
jgi:hypothetical protein